MSVEQKPAVHLNRNSLWWCSPSRRPTANGKRTRVQTPGASAVAEMRGFRAAGARAAAVPGAGPERGRLPGEGPEADEGGRRALLGVIIYSR